MSTTKEWFNKFRFNTTSAFWKFVGFSSLRFWQVGYYEPGLRESMADVDLDRVLCPELFFSGFMKMLSHRYSFNEIENDEPDNDDEKRDGIALFEDPTPREEELMIVLRNFRNDCNPSSLGTNDILDDIDDAAACDLIEILQKKCRIRKSGGNTSEEWAE